MSTHRPRLHHLAPSDPSQDLVITRGAIVVLAPTVANLSEIRPSDRILDSRYLALAGIPRPLFTTPDGTVLIGDRIGRVDRARYPRRSPWAQLIRIPGLDPAVDPAARDALAATYAITFSEGVDVLVGLGDVLELEGSLFSVRQTPGGSPVLELQKPQATMHHLI